MILYHFSIQYHRRYGHLTWEWAAGLRSYLHPTIYAFFYWLVALVGADAPAVIALGPRCIQAGFAALADLYVCKMSLRLFGAKTARYVVFLLFFVLLLVYVHCFYLPDNTALL